MSGELMIGTGNRAGSENNGEKEPWITELCSGNVQYRTQR